MDLEGTHGKAPRARRLRAGASGASITPFAGGVAPAGTAGLGSRRGSPDVARSSLFGSMLSAAVSPLRAAKGILSKVRAPEGDPQSRRPEVASRAAVASF